MHLLISCAHIPESRVLRPQLFGYDKVFDLCVRIQYACYVTRQFDMLPLIIADGNVCRFVQ
jgi:hypothetical protein